MVDEARKPYNSCMDEILIEGRVFISSKQAAKITGYAKDYVGQLCREGRVEARLVGRNWYVLEESVREHRFGKPVEEFVAPVQVEGSGINRVSTWQEPQYRAEVPAMVPDLAPKPVAAPAMSNPAIQDMQSAWKEWFEEKRPLATAAPEEVSEEYTPIPVPEEPAVAPEVIEEEEEVVISRISQERVYEVSEPEEESQVEVHRSYGSRGPKMPASGVPVVDLSPRMRGRETRLEQERAGTSGILRAAMIVVALAAILIAIVGTGNAERLLAGTSFDFGAQKSLIDFLDGRSTYDSSL